MYPLRLLTSSIHRLLGVTILPLHRMHDKVSPLFQPQCILGELPFRLPKSSEWQSSEDALKLEEGVIPCHAFHEVRRW
jgi:hypothetical protein